MRGTIKTYVLMRHKDLSGVSGIGVVAEATEFTDGTFVVHWSVPDRPSSTTVYKSKAEAEQVHGHDGTTHFVPLNESAGWQILPTP